MNTHPIPENEMDRLNDLADYDLDYSNLNENFKDLAKLAAKIAGTSVSLVNLIDSFTQWSVSNYGLEIDQMPREESVCQYTIMGDKHFEVEDLSVDSRFKDRPYVANEPNLRYYYGVPLKSENGNNLGALCVMDKKVRGISPEKMEMLKIIADEIVNRLKTYKAIDSLRSKLLEANETKKKVAHDIRGPLGGIIGLAQVISEQGKENQIDEVLEFINLIHKSGRSILDLADEILSDDRTQTLRSDEFNLNIFKDKLEKLYAPQARNKNVTFVVTITPISAHIAFSKNKLLQITGNLISNALKFTPKDGKVTVDLNLEVDNGQRNLLRIKVTDTGVGLNKASIDKLLKGTATSTDGTGGEQGYGFGMALVKRLIDSLHGEMEIYSEPGNGAAFQVNLPQA